MPPINLEEELARVIEEGSDDEELVADCPGIEEPEAIVLDEIGLAEDPFAPSPETIASLIVPPPAAAESSSSSPVSPAPTVV